MSELSVLTEKRLQYVRVSAEQVPDGLIYYTPPFFQNQHIEVSYAWSNPERRDLAVAGARWKRVIDHSRPTGHPEREWYFRLEGGER